MGRTVDDPGIISEQTAAAIIIAYTPPSRIVDYEEGVNHSRPDDNLDCLIFPSARPPRPAPLSSVYFALP